MTLHIKSGLYTLYYSPIHEEEIGADPNKLRRSEMLKTLYRNGNSTVELRTDDERLEQRGWELADGGLGIADAFHLAYAEAIGADFITCDDQMLRRARRHDVAVWYGTPVDFLTKEGIA